MTTRRARVTTTLLNNRIKALNRQLPLAIDGDDRGVHQARVATRRLREAVPVLATGLKHSGAKKASRKLRKLTRAMGSVRELDVTGGLIDELPASDDLSKAALQDVRLHVDQERKRRREAMLSRLRDVKLEKLGRRLGSVVEAISLDSGDAWRRALAARLVSRARALGDRIGEAGHLYAPEQLHQVRIAVKKLRYALEVAGEGGVAGAGAHVRSLKRIQEILGRLHDFQVLQTHVAAVQVAARGRTAPHPGLAAIAGRIEEQCRLLHGRYVAAVPALRQLVVAVRGDIVPRMTKPRLGRSRRALKMSLPRGRRTAARR